VFDSVLVQQLFCYVIKKKQKKKTKKKVLGENWYFWGKNPHKLSF